MASGRRTGAFDHPSSVSTDVARSRLRASVRTGTPMRSRPSSCRASRTARNPRTKRGSLRKTSGPVRTLVAAVVSLPPLDVALHQRRRRHVRDGGRDIGPVGRPIAVEIGLQQAYDRPADRPMPSVADLDFHLADSLGFDRQHLCELSDRQAKPVARLSELGRSQRSPQPNRGVASAISARLAGAPVGRSRGSMQRRSRPAESAALGLQINRFDPEF